MSSISRRRNGLIALSVIGAPVLGAVFSPSISRQDACLCYSPRPFPCYKLPPERFSPSAPLAHSARLSQMADGDPMLRRKVGLKERRRPPRIPPPVASDFYRMATNLDCSASSGGGPVWVTGGKTPSEYMLSELAQLADIVRRVRRYSASPLVLRITAFWVRAIPR